MAKPSMKTSAPASAVFKPLAERAIPLRVFAETDNVTKTDVFAPALETQDGTSRRSSRDDGQRGREFSEDVQHIGNG